ncbi:hypothetical protein [Natrinema hispanicum]|uniref:Iron complex transport system ATP-binding protein n=1 Tax=Natrinema hispanicum TaxID=392421 RepID=A0A1G6VL31_9EURY|nr:hypothetical protein [Natrinema hispanicum]SDD53605.1 iron complex transport system ATP-binding protein [Natrinema hispanicum]SET92518.1 iron complex transport system ATP-binding protein [Natrinema hispanicum]
MELVSTHVQKRDVAVVAALHDLNLATRYCDRLVLLHDGRIYDAGSLEILTPDTIRTVYGANVSVVHHDGERVIVPDTSSRTNDTDAS